MRPGRSGGVPRASPHVAACDATVWALIHGARQEAGLYLKTHTPHRHAVASGRLHAGPAKIGEKRAARPACMIMHRLSTQKTRASAAMRYVGIIESPAGRGLL